MEDFIPKRADTYEDLKEHEKMVIISDISQVLYKAVLIGIFEIESSLNAGNNKYRFKINIEEE